MQRGTAHVRCPARHAADGARGKSSAPVAHSNACPTCQPISGDAIGRTCRVPQTGAPGIYYEDYPELSGFNCPAWSHLSAGDSVEFSKRLIPHLRKALQL